MFTVGILGWWYREGLIGRLRIIQVRLISLSDLFSIGLLIQTMFDPFRQISASSSSETLPEQLRAFVDNLISRLIGAFVRFFTAIFGLAIIAVVAIFNMLILLFWLILPTFPIVGLILMFSGWVPSWID